MSEIINIMNIVAISQGFFLGVILLFKKNNNLSNRLLSALFLAMSLSIMMNYFQMTANWKLFYYAIYINLSFYFLYGPLMYLYTLSITGSMEQDWRKYWPHFVPFVVFFIYLVIRHRIIEWTGEMEFKPFYENTSLFSYPNQVKVYLFINLVYIYRSMFIIRKYKVRLKNYFSDVEKISLVWLSMLLGGYSVFILLLIVFLFIYSDLTVNYFNSYLVMVIYTTYLATIYMATFFTIRYPEIFDFKESRELDDSGDRAPRYEKLRLDDDIRLQYTEDLLRYMKQQKPHLRDSLTLRELADLVKIPHHHLSIVINTILNQNFFMFINGYRVEEAKRLLSDPLQQDVNILTIAFNSGFNSKTTFNTIFKQITGMTPTEYRKSGTSPVEAQKSI